jgi:hypothetical protein
MLSGCGSMAKPQIGAIQFTSETGAGEPDVTTLAVNGQAYMIATVTNDDQALGVSWTVTCGSATGPGGTSIDNSCGTCDPAQTASGPVPSYPSTGIIATYNAPSKIPKGATVTITAHVTALPSVTSSVTLTIVPAKNSFEPASMRGRRHLQAEPASTARAMDAMGKALSSGL